MRIPSRGYPDNTIVMGIDPGYSGAIAMLTEGRTLADVADMPIKEEAWQKKTRSILDLEAIKTYVKAYNPFVAYVEEVGARPGQGVTSMFRFGRGLGQLEGLLAALDVRLVYVKPQDWKKAFGLLGTEKDASLTMARTLFPDADLRLKKHHGRAEALCIAEYGRRLIRGNK